jgi:hypothetical protein
MALEKPLLKRRRVERPSATPHKRLRLDRIVDIVSASAYLVGMATTSFSQDNLSGGFQRVIAVFDLEPISLGRKGHTIHFRVEIMKRTGARRLEARLWRYEFFRLQSTFPQAKGKPIDEPSDELVLVEDHTVFDNPIKTPYGNPDAAFRYVLKRLRAALRLL